jgi:hypothetical protein
MIVDWQYEPVKSHLLHIDFKRIAMDKAIRVEVPVLLTGIPIGVRTQGGILDQVLREVEIECLPGDIPSSIELDVTELTFGQVKRVSDLDHGGKLKFLTPEDSVVAHVVAIKEEVVATPDATAAVAGAPAEPEVVKKGKQDAEGAADTKAKSRVGQSGTRVSVHAAQCGFSGDRPHRGTLRCGCKQPAAAGADRCGNRGRQASAAGQAADLHEPERRQHSRAAGGPGSRQQRVGFAADCVVRRH